MKRLVLLSALVIFISTPAMAHGGHGGPPNHFHIFGYVVNSPAAMFSLLVESAVASLAVLGSIAILAILFNVIFKGSSKELE